LLDGRDLAARQIDLGRLGGEVARRLCDLLGLTVFLMVVVMALPVRTLPPRIHLAKY
jgi:hypothetical protein